MTPPPPEESMVAGDPTQRLLTALGRFQRQVTRAEEGTPQDSWCDECMNQLIIGIEIALNEDWADVKEALTDAARILQTYEDAGRAGQCVPFLKDSYEILCLMVGDLIVGNVRSGVMKKWQERYEWALDELASAGLTLVDDEGPTERETSNVGARDENALDSLVDHSAGGTAVSSFDSDAVAPGRTRAFATSPDDPFAPLEDFSSSGGDSPFPAPEAPPEAAADAGQSRFDDSYGQTLGLEDEYQGGAGAAAAEPELSDDFTADTEVDWTDTAPEEQTGVDDDGLAADAAAPDADPPEVPDPGSATPDALDDSAFDGGARESTAPEAASPAATPEPVQAELAHEGTPAPVEAMADPAPEREPDPGTPEALLWTAQRAMAAGNVSDAKLFALQLAVDMAKLEADQVAGQISLIEEEIASNSDAVSAGDLAVNEAEGRLRKLEEEAAQFQAEVESKRQHIGELREEVSSVESAVDDLNRQIAELEARRDEEAQRLGQCQANLEDSLSEEQRMLSELESLHEEEAGSRENLDGAREHVRALREAATAHAEKLETTQAELDRRQQAVSNIEATIQHVSGKSDAHEAPPEQTELLPGAEGESEETDGGDAGEAEHQAGDDGGADAGSDGGESEARQAGGEVEAEDHGGDDESGAGHPDETAG